MLDITLRSLSLLVYLFLISYFFSNWSTAIKNHREFYNVIWIVIIISAMVTIILSNAYIPNIYLPYLNLLLSFILTYTIAMLHSVPYLDSAVWTMTLISINLICEVLSLHFTKIILNAELTSYGSPTFFITSITITTLIGVAWIVILKFSIVKEAKSELSTNLSFIVILLPIPILSIIILFGLLIGNNNDKISEITITISVIFLNICVIFLYKITIEYQKNQYNLTLRKKNIEVEYRILNEEVNEAIDYIKSSFDILEPPTKTYAADGVLNYLLNEKLAEARKNQINVDHQIFVSKNIKINNDVLTIVIGNIIDNAIQASKRIKPIDRYVNIIIKQVNNDLFIEVSNNYNSEEIFTRKHRKNKGLGMKNIDDLLQQLGGIQRHWTKERRYFVTIVIFNVYKGNKCGDN